MRLILSLPWYTSYIVPFSLQCLGALEMPGPTREETVSLNKDPHLMNSALTHGLVDKLYKQVQRIIHMLPYELPKKNNLRGKIDHVETLTSVSCGRRCVVTCFVPWLAKITHATFNCRIFISLIVVEQV